MKMTLRHLIHRSPEAGTPEAGIPEVGIPEAAPRSVEELQARIEILTAERQQLRTVQASAEVLERNRCEIAATQWQLSYALIARYHPTAA
jgi:hypothetical protein